MYLELQWIKLPLVMKSECSVFIYYLFNTFKKDSVLGLKLQ